MNRRLLVVVGVVVGVIVLLAAIGSMTGDDGGGSEPELRAVGAAASVCAAVADVAPSGESVHRAGRSRTSTSRRTQGRTRRTG